MHRFMGRMIASNPSWSQRIGFFHAQRITIRFRRKKPISIPSPYAQYDKEEDDQGSEQAGFHLIKRVTERICSQLESGSGIDSRT